MTDSERLKAYEEMRKNVIDRYTSVTDKMAKLKSEGKERSITYKQFIAEKIFLQEIISMYEIYDIK